MENRYYNRQNGLQWRIATGLEKEIQKQMIRALADELQTFSQKSYSPDRVYEWNIDGLSEREILMVLEQIVIAAQGYYGAGQIGKNQAAKLIVRGFTGQLKHWWENLVLQEDFMAPHNEFKRKWFRETFDNNARLFVRSEWFKFMKDYKMNVSFFTFLPLYFSQNNLEYPDLDINNTNSLTQKWILKDGRVVTSIHPPSAEFVFSQDNVQCTAVPFKKGRYLPLVPVDYKFSLHLSVEAERV